MVTPETLNELDRRVYDLAVQSVPLAEIAVRLGVPVAQADERIQRVCARLGVADRAGLRTWSPKNEANEAESLAQCEPVTEARPPGRHTRRTVIAAAGVGTIAAVGGAFAWRYGRGSSDGDSPSASATAEATSAAADPGFLTRVSFSETWEVTTFPKGELIDWPHGLFLMGVAGGEVRAHRLHANVAINYRTWPGGRFVAASSIRAGTQPAEFLMDILNTATAWWWSAEKLRLIGIVGNLPEATLLFETVIQGKGTGELIVAHSPKPGADLEILRRQTIPATGFEATLIVSPDESAAAIISADAKLTMTMFDDQLNQILQFEGFEIANSRLSVREVKNIRDPDGGAAFLVAVHRNDTSTGRAFDEQALVMPWGKGQAFPPGRKVEQAASFSADGRLFLREVSLRSVASEGADGPREYWPAVEVVETATGKTLQRIRSASIYFGDGGPSNRWFNETWFVTLVRTEQAEDGWDVARLVPSPKKQGWEILNRFNVESGPAFDGTWYQSPWVQGVVPSPSNENLLAIGKFAAVDLRRESFVEANVRTEAGPAHIDPWAAGSGWLAFAFPHLGHGGASPPILLQPKFEPGDTPTDPLRFTVDSRRTYPPPLPRDGPGPGPSVPGESDRLNLRDQPSRSGTVISTLEHGTPLTLAESPDPSRPQGRRGVEQAADGTWIFVRAANGLEGWVNSAFVAWA